MSGTNTAAPVKVSILLHSEEMAAGGEETESLDQMYAGTFYRRSGRSYLHYKEDAGKTSVLIVIEDDGVRIRRRGEAEYEMRFSAGRTVGFFYQARGLALPLAVRTHEIVYHESGDQKKEIRLYLGYDLLAEDAPVSHHTIRLLAQS